MKLFIVLTLFTASVHAEVLLKDIGIIGLMSHDIFAWDHKMEQNTENGRLDLNTIFDYAEGTRWKKGGNPKNGENSPVWTVKAKKLKGNLPKGKQYPHFNNQKWKLNGLKAKLSVIATLKVTLNTSSRSQLAGRLRSEIQKWTRSFGASFSGREIHDQGWRDDKTYLE